jgi:excisionase family DNA binding protein
MTTSALSHETYVPTDEEHQQLLELLHALDSGGEPRVPLALVGNDSRAHALTPQLARLLSQVIRAMSDGHAVTVAPLQRLLTTQEAADLLGVSRPTLIKILEREHLTYDMVGRHRRIQLADLLEYQARERLSRREALRDMVREAEGDGLYDLLDEPPVEDS